MILFFLFVSRYYRSTQYTAADILDKLIQFKSYVNNTGNSDVTKILVEILTYGSDVLILKVLGILANLAMDGSTRHYVVQAGTITCTPKLLESQNPMVVAHTAKVLSYIAEERKYIERIVDDRLDCTSLLLYHLLEKQDRYHLLETQVLTLLSQQ